MSLLIQNCTLRGREGLWNVYCEGKTITSIGQGIRRKADTTINAAGNLLVPALIDPHIHLDKVNILDSVQKNVSGTLTEAIEITPNRPYVIREGKVIVKNIRKTEYIFS